MQRSLDPFDTATTFERSGFTTNTNTGSLNPDVLSGLPSHGGDDDYLLDFYYAFFHDAHPVLPPAHLLRRLAPIPACLTTALKFIGAHYTPSTPPELYRASALSALSPTENEPPSFFHVQAMMLLAVTLHARNERKESVALFTQAVDLALRLGLNHKAYAEAAGAHHDPVKTESMRRTWWELYVLDSMFSAFDQTTLKIGSHVIMDVPLPCDDVSHSTGIYMTDAVTATQFYDRIFGNHDNVEHPSYSYAVEATRVLRRVLRLPLTFDDRQRDQVESLDASIGSWHRHVPAAKAHVLNPADGTVDQGMFRAYMVIHCASIYLHLPRGDLLTTPVANASITCAIRGPGAAPASTPLVHATKAVNSANSLAALATLRSSIVKHTPFFICALVLSAVVQLCACSIRAASSVEPRRDRIALIIGELKSLNTTWAISRRVMQQIKGVAREVLEIGVQPRSAFAAIEDPGPDINALVTSEMWLGDTDEFMNYEKMNF